MLIDDERLTFVEGTVRRSIGPALVEVGAARETNGGTAAQCADSRQVRRRSTSAPKRLSQMIFICAASTAQSIREARLALDAPIKIGRTVLPAHADVHFTDRSDGTRAARGGGATVGEFRPLQPRRPTSATASNICQRGRRRPASSMLGLIGTRPRRRRAAARLDQLRRVAVSAVPQRGAVGLLVGVRTRRLGGRRSPMTRLRHRGARADHARPPLRQPWRVALTGEAATDGSVALGFNLNFSLDPRHGFTFRGSRWRRPARSTRASIATSTTMAFAIPASRSKRARWSRPAPVMAERPTDASGAVTVGGLTTFMPDRCRHRRRPASLIRCSCRKKALQVVVPRPGVPAEVEIGLVGGGDIEGAIVKSGGLGFEGLDLELVDAAGKVVGDRAHRLRRLLPVRARRLRQLHGADVEGSRRSRQGRRRSRRARRRSRPTSRSSGWARSRSTRRRSSRRPTQRPRRLKARLLSLSTRSSRTGRMLARNS